MPGSSKAQGAFSFVDVIRILFWRQLGAGRSLARTTKQPSNL
jgi:hypothetical protein